MRLRLKTVLILCATTILSAALAAFVWFAFYIRHISAMEDGEIEAATRRVASLIADDAEQLDIVVKDWSSWDDSYRYALSADPLFEQSNFEGGQTFESLGLSGFAFVGAAGRVLYSYSATEAALEGDIARIAEGAPSQDHARGLVALGDNIHLAAKRPILRSEGSGESRGAIVMTRVIDAARVARYERLLGVSVSFASLPSPIETIVADAVSVSRSGDRLRAWTALRDIHGNQVARLEVARAGPPFRRTSVLGLLLSTIVICGGGVGVASIALLQSGVFRRIRALEAGLGAISSGRDPEARLSEAGDDEFVELSQVMNRTLDSLGTVIRQRDATLREVHHRVKNNLQVIASLLSLQAGASRSAEAADALLEARRRVISMALVHEELYTDLDLSSISAERFLERLAMALEPRIDGGTPMRVSIDGGSVTIDAWRAIPVGIILSEAISDASRHAFPTECACAMSINARVLHDGGFLIEVRDDGVARPRDQVEDLGISITRILAEQIGGTATIEPGLAGGTVFSLRVPGGPVESG